MLDSEELAKQGREGEVPRSRSSKIQGLHGETSTGAAEKQVSQRIRLERGVRHHGGSHKVGDERSESSGACAVDLTGEDEGDAEPPDGPLRSSVL